MDALELQRDLVLNTEDAQDAAFRVLDHLEDGAINLQVLLYLVLSQRYPEDAVDEAMMNPHVCERAEAIISLESVTGGS